MNEQCPTQSELNSIALMCREVCERWAIDFDAIRDGEPSVDVGVAPFGVTTTEAREQIAKLVILLLHYSERSRSAEAQLIAVALTALTEQERTQIIQEREALEALLVSARNRLGL